MSSRSLNKVLLIGNLTRDPELRYTANGTPVASFGIATNKTWKDTNGEMQESAQFHNIVAWSKMAEICQQILAKGMLVYVEGELNTRSWQGDDGVTKYKTEVRVKEMSLLDSKGKQGTGGNGEVSEGSTSSSSSNPVTEEMMVDDDPGVTEDDPTADDLPF